MARIALIAGFAIAGAVISVMTGGLGTFAVGAWAADIIAGVAVGAAVGSVLSAIIFPPSSNTAPPMNNLQTMSSAYGSPICWGYGAYRIAGQVIWADTIKVHKSQQSAGGGKGGGPTSTVYTYSISAALSFGFGPGKITRVWADSKLIYDATGKGPIAIDTGLTTQNGGAITTPFAPVFYPGTATQPPDPTMQAKQGINSTSAYRDQILLVIHDFPLADYGNRLPNFRAEINNGNSLSYVADLFPGSYIPTPGDGRVFGPSVVSVDQLNRIAFVANTLGSVVQRIDLDVNQGSPATPYQFNTFYKQGDQVLDINGNVQLCIVTHTSRNDGIQPPWATGFGVNTQHDGDGTVFVWTNMGPGPLVYPITLSKGLTWPNADPGSLYTTTEVPLTSGVDTGGNYWLQGWIKNGANVGFAMLRFNPNNLVNDKQAFIRYTGPTGTLFYTALNFFKSPSSGRNYAFAVGQYNNTFGILDCDNGTWLAEGPWNTSGYNGQVAGTNAPPVVDPMTGNCYLLLENTGGTWGAGVASLGKIAAGGTSAQIIPISNAWEIGLSDQPGSLIWDPVDGTLIMMTASRGSVVKINPKTGAIIGTPMANGTTSGTTAQAMSRAYNGIAPADGVLRLNTTVGAGNVGIVYIRCADMIELQRIDMTNWLPAIGSNAINSFAYDVLTNSFMLAGTSSAYNQVSMRIYLDRQKTANWLLSDIIKDLWTKSGADLTDLDVTAVTSVQVKGYPITSPGTGKGLMGPLMAAYFFDLVESDNKLRAVRRGQSVTTIIPEIDMGLEKDKFEANPTVVQENDLPLIMDVLYQDKSQDYQQGKQTYRRPEGVKLTRNRTQISLPLTLSADDAIAISVRCLQTAWAERNQWEFKLWRMNYLRIDPTDVVQFTYQNKVYQSRIGKTAAGQDKTMEITAVSEDPRQYVATPPSAAALGFNPGNIVAVAGTVFFVLDSNLISDSDASPTGNSGYYWTLAARANQAQWPGATLMYSLDNNTFNPVNVGTVPVIYGSVIAATPAPPTLYAWDTVTRISVIMSNNGILTSDTPINVLNGANWFMVGDELMAFANATLQADGKTYILDTLLRGLRGTEQACGTHVDVETFLLVDASMQRQVEPTNLLNTAQYFRAITFGQPATSSASSAVTLTGKDLKPYAPAQLKGTRS